jgi:tRNA(Leu) C34 or U34 (ribose-2'-O)-methylase TrmL
MNNGALKSSNWGVGAAGHQKENQSAHHHNINNNAPRSGIQQSYKSTLKQPTATPSFDNSLDSRSFSSKRSSTSFQSSGSTAVDNHNRPRSSLSTSTASSFQSGPTASGRESLNSHSGSNDSNRSSLSSSSTAHGGSIDQHSLQHRHQQQQQQRMSVLSHHVDKTPMISNRRSEESVTTNNNDNNVNVGVNEKGAHGSMEDTVTSQQSHITTTSSSSTSYTANRVEGGGGVDSVPSFTSSSFVSGSVLAGGGGGDGSMVNGGGANGRGGVNSGGSGRNISGGVESVPSFTTVTTTSTTATTAVANEEDSRSRASRRESLREIKAVLRQEKLSRHSGEHGHLGTVPETATTTAATTGGMKSGQQTMIINQPSREESLDTFRKDTTSTTTTTTNNNNNNKYSSSRGSAGLYTAKLTKKERDSLDVTFKKTSMAVSKMSQASFGKIRDILAGGEGHGAHGGHGGGHHHSTSTTTKYNHAGGGNNIMMGGYRESGIGLGGILHYGRTNSADDEMSFFVSDNDGKVHKEKVPLVNRDEDGVNGGGVFVNGGETTKVLLLEQDKSQLGGMMKMTNDSREGGGEKKSTVSFQNNQQQQRSLFHVKRDENRMSTAPQSPIQPSGHTPPVVRSIKKATKAVSHSMKHEVVPATKAMAALTAKLVERGEKKMKDGVAPKLRAVAMNVDSRLHHHHHHNEQRFIGLQHIEGKGDYVVDPDYHVVRTPQHNIDQAGRRAYGPNAVHNFDPNTPACLLGALTAGTMFNYDITHPEHPEYLPEGIPRVLEVSEDWEERAGFVPAAALVEQKRVMSGPVDLDEEVEDDESSVRVEKMLALQQAVAVSHVNNEVAEEVEEEITDEEDARNASMWVAYNPEEDVEEEDEAMNVGDIIVAPGGEFGGDDKEFSPRSFETGDSNTFHVGDLSIGIKSDDGNNQNETAVVAFQQDQQVPVETFEDDNCGVEDVADDNHQVKGHDSATPMKKVSYNEAHLPHGETPSQQQFTDKKKEFQTPLSVKKTGRPLTFEEFKAMNRGVLCPNEEQAQRTQTMVNADVGRNAEIKVKEEPQRQMTVEQFVSASSRYEQPGHSQRELKGRVVMIRLKKKFSKAVKKAMKQILLTAKIGGTKASANKSISDANFVITIPGVEASAVPDSPSAVSIASNLLSSAISEASNRVIGAAPFSSNINVAPDHLYGAINYHNRTSEDGSGDEESEQLPPPPKMAPNHASDRDDEDVVSLLAEAMNQGMKIDEVLAVGDGQEDTEEEEEQMYLVLTPSEGGEEKVTRVISGKMDGTPVVFNEIMHKNEEGSEIKPHNLSIMFDSGKKEGSSKSIHIMDANDVGGNIVLTPAESNQNVGNVFRRSSTGEASASILQGSTFESEDETLVTHDGNTLVRSDTKDSHDHTITTTTSLKEEEKKPYSTFEIAREEDPRDAANSPTRPAYSHQAASNASFLFSPNNMGRADPKIRAKERAMMRNQSHEGSITMLPSASSMDKSEQQLVLKPKPSYSFDYSAGGDANRDAPPLIASEASVQEPDTPSTVATAVQKKIVMASMTKDRQFSFQSILKQFSADTLDTNSHVPRDVEQKQFASPEIDAGSSESQSKTPVVTNAARKKYAATPFTKAEGSTSSHSKSPSSSSLSSKSRRRSPPREKTLPKSAAKTRTGLVKDRISMFQQRADMPPAVTGVNGRLKRNHSYRLKNERRETNGGGALAPRKAVLQSSAFIRTVPIGISTSYSRDDASFEQSANEADACIEQSSTRNDSYSEDDQSIEKPNSYAKQYMDTSQMNEKAESFGRSSLDSSGCVSEATEIDAFNSLLGKYDDDSSVESDEETLVTDKQKENILSPFKKATLVKPNEINHNRTPLTAQKWRSLAATHGKSSKKWG